MQLKTMRCHDIRVAIINGRNWNSHIIAAGNAKMVQPLFKTGGIWQFLTKLLIYLPYAHEG